MVYVSKLWSWTFGGLDPNRLEHGYVAAGPLAVPHKGAQPVLLITTAVAAGICYAPASCNLTLLLVMASSSLERHGLLRPRSLDNVCTSAKQVFLISGAHATSAVQDVEDDEDDLLVCGQCRSRVV